MYTLSAYFVFYYEFYIITWVWGHIQPHCDQEKKWSTYKEKIQFVINIKSRKNGGTMKWLKII